MATANNSQQKKDGLGAIKKPLRQGIENSIGSALLEHTIKAFRLIWRQSGRPSASPPFKLRFPHCPENGAGIGVKELNTFSGEFKKILKRFENGTSTKSL